MTETRYGLQVEVPVPYAEALEKVAAALKQEGFGVLTTIDVKQTLKQKLNADFRPYTILGACNPPLAHKALSADLDVGLLLPCNVIVYEDTPGAAVVSAIAPKAMLAAAGGSHALDEVAADAEVRLRRAMTALEAPAPAPA